MKFLIWVKRHHYYSFVGVISGLILLKVTYHIAKEENYLRGAKQKALPKLNITRPQEILTVSIFELYSSLSKDSLVNAITN